MVMWSSNEVMPVSLLAEYLVFDKVYCCSRLRLESNILVMD